ncbi:MAG: transcriptional repressor [Buchananella hordeovulneris]|nr:transcriptional repressor [Buchananella hordeovulneris]
MTRITRQRTEIMELLESGDEFRSVQQLHEALRLGGSTTGLATVYRTVNKLAAEGAVDVLRLEDGEARYRRCSTEEHHHHLVCRVCGRTVELDGPPIEEWINQIGATNGFVNIGHTLELAGTCAGCVTELAED